MIACKQYSDKLRELLGVEEIGTEGPKLILLPSLHLNFHAIRAPGSMTSAARHRAQSKYVAARMNRVLKLSSMAFQPGSPIPLPADQVWNACA